MDLDKINAELAIAAVEQSEEFSQPTGDELITSIAINDEQQMINICQDTWDNEGCYYFSVEAQDNLDEPIQYTLDISDTVTSDSTLSLDSLDCLPGEMFLSASCVSTNAVSIYNGQNSLIVEIKTSGEVTLGTDVSAEFAAHEFWHRLAEYGGNFQERIEKLETENSELELQLEDEQSQRIELEALFNDLCDALDVANGDEDMIVAYAKQYREAVGKLEVEAELDKQDKDVEEDPLVAYNRAMKIVR